MTFIRRHGRLLAVATSSLAVGAGASAIATAGAHQNHPARAFHAQRFFAHHPFLRRALIRRTVHADLVVATPTGFATATIDRGTVKGVSGQQLTLADGTRKATWKTVTLSIPATAKVRNNGAPAQLSTLTANERAIVVQAPKHTWVIAHSVR